MNLTKTVFPSLKKIKFHKWGTVKSLEKFLLSAPNLTDLEISHGDIFELPLVSAITKLTALTNLELPYSVCPEVEIPEPETDEDDIGSLFDTRLEMAAVPLFNWIISENPKITNLNLANQIFLHNAEIKSKLQKIIETNTSLKKLTISDRFQAVPTYLFKSLMTNTTLEILNLVECRADVQAREMAAKIMKEKNVKIILNFRRKT